MSHHTTPHRRKHRLGEVLRERRLRQDWLALQIGYSHVHVRAVVAGTQPAGPRFRAQCARVLGLPESDLFIVAQPPPDAPPQAVA